MLLPPRTAFVMLCAIGLAGCGAFDATKESAAGRGPVVEALLQPAGGGPWQGSAKFTDRGDGVLVTLFFTNQIPGTYRLAVHANGNCSSPNFFSAGPPWVPAGSGKTPAEMTPEIHTNSDGDVAATFQMHGVKISGENSLQGRSIIIHWGREINGTESGAANKRVLCGVIGPVRSFLS